MSETKIEVPFAFHELFTTRDIPYYIYWGGRGSGKSTSVATAIVHRMFCRRERVLCVREFQTSIGDSVHQLLRDRILALGLLPWFRITQNTIECPHTKSTAIFKGLKTNPASVRSLEGITITWAEEAQRISKQSWRDLIPTVRRMPHSTIMITMNPENETDPTYQDFIIHPPYNAIVRKVNWDQNNFFPDTLNEERLHMLHTDPDTYGHVWDGNCLAIGEAIIFRGKFSIECFETPSIDQLYNNRFFYGADFGFANDPSALIRCFIKDDCLWIDHEFYGYHIELDDLPSWYETVPGSREWPIKADAAAPATISHVYNKGFNISAAAKWQGSVEDGIRALRSFKKIIIHERCTHTAEEFRLYHYKVDPKTEQVLPIIIDAHNHAIDSVRYSLDGYIEQGGTGAGLWAEFGKAFE